MFCIDGDFKTGMGDCKYHCSPSCHPGQCDPDKWHYGCLHKAWPSNRIDDFCPLVECGGEKAKCELKTYKYAYLYKRGKTNSLNYTRKKLERLEKEIQEFNELMR